MTAAAGQQFYAALAAELGVEARPAEPLSRHTTMRVGGPADWLFLPRELTHAARLWAELRRGPLPVRVLGAGSNVVVCDEGVRAAVIATEGLAQGARLAGAGVIEAPAGTPIPGLVRWAAERGLAGLEFAEGIPAQLGGAIRMNAGANRSWFGAVVESAWVAGEDGSVVERAVESGDFGYRDSFAARAGLLVLGARLRLQPDEPDAIRGRIASFRERRRATQPVQARSAGCVFANYPEQSVGALVERLGLKGTRVGDAEVSTLHGNFVVNRGSARAADVLELIEMLQQRLTAETGQPPRLEVEIWR
ncbi:MAG: UDP-N-acetylmuramate dehydrogenase [Acidobacteria bacterium]|nr:UDP-N-acetylmuramate dehydrogenase [Acidobacteriota bacterium]